MTTTRKARHLSAEQPGWSATEFADHPCWSERLVREAHEGQRSIYIDLSATLGVCRVTAAAEVKLRSSITSPG